MYPMVVAIGHGGSFALDVHECLDHDWLFFDSTRDLDECPIDMGSFELVDPGVYLLHVELVTVLSLDEGFIRVPEPELQVREVETLLAHESISSVIGKDPVDIKEQP